MLVVAGLVLAWLAVVAVLLLGARSEILDARDAMRDVRDDAGGAGLLEGSTLRRLDAVTSTLRDATSKLDHPVMAPLRILPVVGRQVRSVDALASGATRVATVARDTLAEVQAIVEEVDEPSTDRVDLIREVAGLAEEARVSLGTVDPGPHQALVAPLHDARREFVEDLAEVRGMLADVALGAEGLAEVFDGPECYLLFAANNAEMRAGSGMFLQAGDICFDAGRISLGDLRSTSDLELGPDTVAVPDEDLAARWGILLPNAEFRNLALSPRFPPNAELAADMWRAATGRSVAGVLVVDPIALRAVLEATGPIRVDGTRYSSRDVVDQLLVEQYEDFLDEDYDPESRRQTLGKVARAAVESLDDGDWRPAALLDGLPEAAAGRHLLAWSSDEGVQRAFESLGIAGRLAEDSIAVSVLNRGGGDGGGKLDPALEVEAALEVGEAGSDGRPARLVIEMRNTAEPGEPTYTESPDPESVRYGVYQGILAVNLPGTAVGSRIVGQDSLYAVGRDGPTRVVAARFELEAGKSSRFVVEFTLPATLREVTIEPSARRPAIRWRTDRRPRRDTSHFTLNW